MDLHRPTNRFSTTTSWQENGANLVDFPAVSCFTVTGKSDAAGYCLARRLGQGAMAVEWLPRQGGCRAMGKGSAEAMALTAEEFVTLVRNSQLVEGPALDDWVALQRDEAGSLPQPDLLARRMVESELLTAWQARKLLQGKYKGFILGRYKLLDQIGIGGMSRVYLAEHLLLRQRRAVKVLNWQRLKRPGQLERFQMEAQATAALDHPQIVRAYDFDRAGEVCYLVTEYVPGKDLQRLVQEQGPLDIPRAVNYIIQAAEALHFAHQHGFVHRDVKPANLMVDRRGQVKVLDLGLVLIPDCQEGRSLDEKDRVVGTADYLAPEQSVHCGHVDHRADIYGLGCTLYFLITGRPPFSVGSPSERIAAHRSKAPIPPRAIRRDCPLAVERVCLRMMDKDPKRRYQSAAEVARILHQWLACTGQPSLMGVGRSATNTAFTEGSSDLPTAREQSELVGATPRIAPPASCVDTLTGEAQETLVDLPPQSPPQRLSALTAWLLWLLASVLAVAAAALTVYFLPWLVR